MVNSDPDRYWILLDNKGTNNLPYAVDVRNAFKQHVRLLVANLPQDFLPAMRSEHKDSSCKYAFVQRSCDCKTTVRASDQSSILKCIFYEQESRNASVSRSVQPAVRVHAFSQENSRMSHPTVGIALLGTNVSDRLSSSSAEPPGIMIFWLM